MCAAAFCHQPIARARECCGTGGTAQRAATEETVGRLRLVNIHKIEAFESLFDAYGKDNSGYLVSSHNLVGMEHQIFMVVLIAAPTIDRSSTAITLAAVQTKT